MDIHTENNNKEQRDARIGVRINKFISQKGLATRREADTLIISGKVFVNGTVASLGMDVNESDKIEIRDNKKEYRYFLYNKPKGVVTVGAQKGEVDILHKTKFPFDKAQGKPVNVFPIGRLDKDSSGLIIMTNDGRVTKEILTPEQEHEKEYLVSVDKMLPKSFKNIMESGVKVPKTNQGKEGYTTKPSKVKITGDKTFTIVITEGKNRQIRRMCETLGYAVTSLERIRIGKFMLGKLKPGEWREIKSIN